MKKSRQCSLNVPISLPALLLLTAIAQAGSVNGLAMQTAAVPLLAASDGPRAHHTTPTVPVTKPQPSGLRPLPTRRRHNPLPELVVQAGHRYTKFRYLPDGRTLVAGGAGPVDIWNTRTGELQLSIAADATEFELSPNGATIASNMNQFGSDVAIRNIRTGSLLRILSNNDQRDKLTTDFAFSADSRVLAVSHGFGSVDLWNIRSGILLHSIEPEDGMRFAVLFSADGTRLFTGSRTEFDGDTTDLLDAGGVRDASGHPYSDFANDPVDEWNVRTGKLVQHFERSRGVYAPLALSPDGATLATRGADPNWKMPPLTKPLPTARQWSMQPDQILLWDVHSGKLIRTLKGNWGPNGGTRFIRFSRDGARLFTGRSGPEAVWNWRTGELLTHPSLTPKPSWRPPLPAVPETSFLALGPSGRTLAAAYPRSKVALWDLQTGRLLRVFPVKVIPTGVGFTKDAQTLATAEDLTVHPLPPQYPGSPEIIPPIRVREWNPNTGKLQKTWTTAGGEVGAYSQDFHQKASQIRPNNPDQLFVKIIDTESNKLLTTLPGMLGWGFNSMKFSLNNGYLTGMTQNPKGAPVVALWDLHTSELLNAAPMAEDATLNFSPDSSLLATARSGDDYGIRLWSTKGGFRKAGLPSKQIDVGAFAPDNHVLAAIGPEHRFGIYETKTGNPIKSFAGYKEKATVLLFTADGSKLIAAYADGAIRIYDWRKGRLLLTL